MKKVDINLYYDDIDNTKVKEFKIRYLAYGILILVSSIVLFILEFNNKYGFSKTLDNIVSFSLFLNMALGIVFIIRVFTIKDRIKADTLINISNYVYKEKPDGSLIIKPSFSVIRALHIVTIFMNVSIITAYSRAIGLYDSTMKLVVSFIFALIVFLLPIISIISLDNEKEIYKKIEE